MVLNVPSLDNVLIMEDGQKKLTKKADYVTVGAPHVHEKPKEDGETPAKKPKRVSFI